MSNVDGKGDERKGQAADALTPPTMKFGSQAGSPAPTGHENTIQMAPTAGGGGSHTLPARPSSNTVKTVSNTVKTVSAPGNTGSLSAQSFTMPTGLQIQDLSGERLLLAAPRTDAFGHSCPTLNGIPLLTKIGQGGMGAVYYGVHPRLRSEVAVKVLPFHLAEQDPGMIQRFFREAQIAAQVRSPHLVNVMDVNEEAGLFFLVMEYVSGRTAGQYIKAIAERGQPVREIDALDLVIAATEGLWAAHSNAVVHRDIKPENIMIPYSSRHTSQDFDLRRAKLMDLGLARSEESQQSLTGAQAAMGTPGYMAPEQAMDAKTADKRSDVFSMGATVYALLTGRPPFKGETIMKVLMATMHEPHEPIKKVRADISQITNDVLERCLAKKAEQRFPDAKVLLAALEDCKRVVSGQNPGASQATYVFNPVSSPDSGTNATVMNAPDAAGVVAKNKNKGILYIGGGIAAAGVLAAAIALSGGKKDDTVDNDPKKPINDPKTVVRPKIDPERRPYFLKKFGENEKAIQDLITSNDSITANIELEELNRNPLADEPEMKTRIAALVKGIGDIAKRDDFKRKVKDLDGRLDLGKFDEEETQKLAATVEGLAAGLGEAEIAEFTQRSDRMKSLRVAAAQEKQFTAKLAEGLEAQKASDLTKWQSAVDALVKLKPDDKAVLKQVEDLRVALGDRDRKDRYDKGLKEVDALKAAQNWDKAYEKVQELLILDPYRKEAVVSRLELEAKLGEAKAREQELKSKAQATEKVTAAQGLLAENKFDEAQEAAALARRLDPKNEAAGILIDAISAARKKYEQDERRREAITAVNAKLAEARKYYDNDATTAADLDSIEKDLEPFKNVLASEGQVQKALREMSDLFTQKRARIALIAEVSKMLPDARKAYEDARRQPNEQMLATAQTAIDAILNKMPDQPDALRMNGEVQGLKDKLFKDLKDKKERNDRLLADGESKAKLSETAATLSDKVRLLEESSKAFDRAEKESVEGSNATQRKGEIAKLVETARAELLKRERIDGVVTKAQSHLRMNDFESARKELAAIQKDAPTDYDARIKDVADAETKALQVIETTKKNVAAQIAAKDLSKARDAARSLATQFNLRTDVNQLSRALEAAYRTQAEIDSELRDARQAIEAADRRLKRPESGVDERKRLNLAITAIQDIVTKQLNTLTAGNFADVATFETALANAKRPLSTELSGAKVALGNVYDAQAPRQVEDITPRREEPRRGGNSGGGGKGEQIQDL